MGWDWKAWKTSSDSKSCCYAASRRADLSGELVSQGSVGAAYTVEVGHLPIHRNIGNIGNIGTEDLSWLTRLERLEHRRLVLEGSPEKLLRTNRMNMHLLQQLVHTHQATRALFLLLLALVAHDLGHHYLEL